MSFYLQDAWRPRANLTIKAGLRFDNVKITMFSSLVVDLAREIDADFIVKGLRTAGDFEIEQLDALFFGRGEQQPVDRLAADAQRADDP